MDTFPDLGALSDQELKDLIQQLTEEEQEVSYQRRILHGKIDILRAELVNRLRKKHEEGEPVITGADVQQLTDILSGKSGIGRARVGRERAQGTCTAPSAGSSTARALTTARSAVPSSPASASPSDATTAQYQLDDESGELRPVDAGAAVPTGGVLVIRAGGGRAGETFELSGERIAIGRSPDADVFLDDVTVSRNHALLVQAPRRALSRRPRLAERLLRQPAPDRVAQAAGG